MTQRFGEMPGGPVNYSTLYTTRVDQSTMKEVGIKTPEGKWYPFNDGEEFAQFNVDGVSDRLPAIKLKDGRVISFEEWEDAQQSKETASGTTTKNHLPGGPVKYSLFYTTKVRVQEQQKAFGVRTPSGEWCPFENGEKFVQVGIEGVSDRLPAIKLQDGKIISFAEWKSTQPKRERPE